MLTVTDDKGLKSLALIALEVGLDSDSLSNCIVEAWKHKRSKCEGLVVSFRRETEFFLFTREDEILGQFSLPTKILRNKGYFREYLQRYINRIQKTHKRK